MARKKRKPGGSTNKVTQQAKKNKGGKANESDDEDDGIEFIDPERGLKALKRRGAPQKMIDDLREARVVQNERVRAREARAEAKNSLVAAEVQVVAAEVQELQLADEGDDLEKELPVERKEEA